MWFPTRSDRLSICQYPLARLLVVLTVVLGVTAPSVSGVVAYRVEESKSPVETEEESQEKLEGKLQKSKRRFRLKLEYRKRLADSQQSVQADRCASCPSSHSEGHRLSNGFLAPLTC